MATQYDTDHATFVRQEYRYANAGNTDVQSRNPSAMALKISTQLGQAAAQILANKMLADGAYPRVFEIELDGLLDPQMLIAGVPTWIINTIQYAGDDKARKLFSVGFDYENNRTVIKVRG